MIFSRLILVSLSVLLLGPSIAAAKSPSPLMGETESVHSLAPENNKVRGLAFDEASPKAPRLFVLDASGKVFAYRIPTDAKADPELVGSMNVPGETDERPLAGLRGLAFAREDGRDILYFLNWDDTNRPEGDDRDIVSQLWRWDINENTSTFIDLSRYTNRIGDREPFDLTLDNGDIVICFKSTGYRDEDTRVQRGLVRLRWPAPRKDYPEFVRHMPDAGTDFSRGVAAMELDGAKYLWATAGNDHVYCADGPTGRGLFFFELPKTVKSGSNCWGLGFGAGSLWVLEDVDRGPDQLHRVNVTKNLDVPVTGPKIVRRLNMSIRTEPEARGTPNPGRVQHNYSRPYDAAQMPNQGIWPKTERIADASDAPNAAIVPFTHDPAGDVSSRQYMQSVVYADAPARTYRSEYQIDLWTNSYRTFVYPHRVDDVKTALRRTNYLEDDPELYNLTDKKTYDGFLERIKKHIEDKYGVPADMENAYWAARNTIEYIQDVYYYPNRAKRKPAAVDYSRKHYDANPGNLKIELSDRPYDKTQIIACSGTSVMVAGTMRYIGIPARWLGTSTQQGPAKWDTNRNGILDEGETATCTNGHRYSQVWLGSRYGWICFDGTPSKPDLNDYDPVPPLQTQWRYMQRCGSGHLTEKRIVLNVGSKLFRPLYRDFKYDERAAVHNACGGDQRYNLKGRFEKSDLWRPSGDGISVENLCFIEDVKLYGPKDKTKVTWKLKGDWDLDRSARLDVTLERSRPGRGGPRTVATLAEGIPYRQRSVELDLSKYRGDNLRISVRKVGDSETGGLSAPFTLP